MKKKILIILSVFIISLIVVSGAYFLLRQAIEDVGPGDTDKQMIFSPEPLSPEELSLEQEIFDKAIKDVDADSCSKIKLDISKEICYTQVALGGAGESACSLINNEVIKNNCLEELKVQIALSGNDLKSCLNISSEEAARFCVIELAKEKTKEDCNQIDSGRLRDDCLTTVNYQAAKESSSADLCWEIPDRMVTSNCLSEILGIDNLSDADGDGLKFFEEILNGTDPNKADSDGDSYLDADEVASGYNPIGEGLAGYYYLNCYEIQEAPLREACLLESENGRINYQNCLEVQNEYLREYCLKKLEK